MYIYICHVDILITICINLSIQLFMHLITYTMNQEKIIIRGLLRHYWKKGQNATTAAREICKVEGENVVNARTAQRWFERFGKGDMTLEDDDRSGRPITVDDEALLEAIEHQPNVSTRKLSSELGTSHMTISRRFNQLGLVNRRCQEVPHELTPDQAQQRVDVCRQLLSNPNDLRFIKRIVTGDEKWIYLRNSDNSNQWRYPGQPSKPVVKRGRFDQKVMLCVWWNYEGVIHFELVPNGRTVNSSLYCEQLHRVYEILCNRYPALVNRNAVLLQQDNAKPHTSRVTRQKIEELNGIELLPHPPYSPDLAPSDYYLFRSMAHFLKGRHFENFDEVENGCREFFESKNPEWYRSGIEQLAHRWLETVEHGGLYFAQ